MPTEEEYDFVVAEYHCLDMVQRQTDDLYVSFVGTQRCPPRHDWGPARREEYLMHFVISGKGLYEVNGTTYPLRGGQVFLITPGAMTYYCADGKDPWQYTWVGFGGRNVPAYLNHIGFAPDRPVLDCGMPPEIYQELIREMLGNRELTLANEVRRAGCLYQLFSLMIRMQYQAPRARGGSYDYPYEAYVEYAQEYIAQNFREARVSDVAGYIGINRSYLTSIFKKLLGVSPQEYLVRYRLEKARQLLRETDQSIQAVSEQVGYASPLTFSKMFKRYFQESPRTYRNSSSGKNSQDD